MQIISFFCFFCGILVALNGSFWIGAAIALLGPMVAFLVIALAFMLISKLFA